MSEYKGLTSQEAKDNKVKYGENILTPPAKRPLWLEFLEKFQDPIIRILLIALLLSFGVSLYHIFAEGAGMSVLLEPAGILVAILLATLVGFILEVKANKAFEVLNKVNDDTPVKVYRDSVLIEVPKRDITVGDIIVLEQGDEVPADSQVLESISLAVNESSLTGEPMARKGLPQDAPQGAEMTYPYNHLLRGCSIIDGHCVAKVFAIGDSTEYGKVYVASKIESAIKTPLDQQLEKLGNLITKLSYAVAVLIVVGRMLIYFMGGEHLPFDWAHFATYLLNTFMLAVTLIVVAVPEGLPMSVTLSLALSMQRMLATNNLVRKIHACETMGATTVICTDKTGTLTMNQMRVAQMEMWTEKYSFIDGLAVNSTAHLKKEENGSYTVLGNPTEGALLLWSTGQGADIEAVRGANEIIDQIPFSTERKYMATAIAGEGKKVRLYVKGAPEIVMNLVKNRLVAGAPKVEEIQSMLRGFQANAMRTLGFAYCEVEKEEFEKAEVMTELFDKLELVGVVAIADPVRPTVPAAIRQCVVAGIDVKMVTGDTSVTAVQIAKEVGLIAEGEALEGRVITGPEFAALSDDEVLELCRTLKVIARARPLDKERLVKALQAKEEVVAVTGDGTNDAPALNAAQVGLSMGDGTSVAKEASDITILDNSFDSIVNAVMWGRSLYKNIQRFILFQLTINVAASLIVLIGAFTGEESPLTVTQMLWVNLIMDTFAAIALASLPPSRTVLNEKPRRMHDFIIGKKMGQLIFGVGIAFVVALFGLLFWMKADGGLDSRELTVFFTTFVMLQFWNMFNAKAFMTGRSAFAALKDSKGFMWMLVVILLGQIFIVNLGGDLFNVSPISLKDWGMIIASTSVVMIVGEIGRVIASSIKR